MATEFVDIDWRARRVRIEHAWIGGTEDSSRPLVVFLHEGLGSVSMWKDFPQRLCDAAQWRGLVFSRPGYGRSTPRERDEHWDVDYLHRQAHEVLPALFDVLRVRAPVWLFGHSDGASIALLHAARHPVAGAVLLAPHLFVEERSVASIEQTRLDFDGTDLAQRLARHHDDVESAFWGWNRIWLKPAFRDWNIEPDIHGMRCPLLAIQGLDDPYGTLEQIHRLQRLLPQTRLLELPDCAHSPHRDQPEAVIAACTEFFAAHAHAGS
jgi:pimeloyl-ACP methyl ester carboxylesterase